VAQITHIYSTRMPQFSYHSWWLMTYVVCLSYTTLLIIMPVLLNTHPASYSMGIRSSFSITGREYTQKYHGMHRDNFTF